jgi:hypothetical protein
MPVINLDYARDVDLAIHSTFRIGFKRGFLWGFALASLSATLIVLWVRP